jgi:hypothetical protein
MPPVLDRLHEEALRSYSKSGESELGVVDYTRVTLIVSKAGALLPVLSSFKDAPIDDQEGFIWAMRELRTETNYILLSPTGALLGVSAGSQALLGVDPLLLATRAVALSEFIPGWDAPASLELLRKPDGAQLTVTVEAPTDFSEAASGGGASSATTIHARLQILNSFEGSAQVLHWQRGAPAGASQRLARSTSASQLQSPAAARTPRGGAAAAGASPPQPLPPQSPPQLQPPPSTMPLERPRTPDDAALGDDAPAADGDSVEVGTEEGEARKDGDAPPPPPPTSPPPRGILSASGAPARALASFSDEGGAQQAPAAGAVASPREGRAPPAGDAGAATPAGGAASVVRFAGVQSPTRKEAAGGDRNSEGGDSQNSGKTSVASTSRAVNRLRRILANAAPMLLPGLVLLRYAGAALVVLSVGLAVVLTYITLSNFNAISNIVLFVDLGVEKMITKATAVLRVQDLMFLGRGWHNLTSHHGNPARVREEIISLAAEFANHHLEMYRLLPPAAIGEWTRRYITVRNYDVPPSALYTPFTTLNLLEVGNLFSTTLRQLGSEEISPDSVYGEFFDGCAKGPPLIASLNTDFTRFGNAHEAMAASIPRGFDSTHDNVLAVTQTQTFVFLGMMLSAAVVGLLVFVPILLRVDAAGDKILVQFVQIPPMVRRVLYDLSVKRLRLLRRDYADEDGDDDVDLLEEDEGGGGGTGAPGGAPGSGGSVAGGLGDLGFQLDEDDPNSVASSEVWARAFAAQVAVKKTSSYSAAVAARAAGCCGAPAAVGSASAGFTPYSKSKSALLVLVLRFLFPIIFLVGLFSTVFGTFTAHIRTTEALTAIATAAGMRAACARQAIVGLHKLQYVTVNAEYLNTAYYYTMAGFDCVRSHTRLLVYGTFDPSMASKSYAPYVGRPESGAGSALSSTATAAAYQAMHGDACAFLLSTADSHDADFNVTKCREFDGGIMAGGLVAVVEKWWVAGYKASDRQLRGAFTATEAALLKGEGWSLPSATFNYSSVVCRPDICNPGFVLAPTAEPLPPTYVSDPAYAGDVRVEDEHLLPNGTIRYSVKEELSSAENEFLVECDELYLTPALTALFLLYAHESLETTDTYLHFLNIFVPLLCVLLFCGPTPAHLFFAPLTPPPLHAHTRTPDPFRPHPRTRVQYDRLCGASTEGPLAVAFARTRGRSHPRLSHPTQPHLQLIMLVWFLPQTTAENAHMQTKRSMLLYLPVQVLHRVRSMREIVAQILAADAAAQMGQTAAAALGSSSARVRPL